MKRIKTILILSLLILFSSCSHKDVGKIDYRKAIKIKIDGNLTKNKYIPLEKKDYSFDNKKLQFDDKGNDRLSIHLKTAYIKHFKEFASTEKNHINKGEIAIIVNAFEMNNRELSFSNFKEGRVVFYSDDVYEGQILNFNNMPIYGPKIYKGYPFAFRLSILELDTSKYIKGILNTLADVGGMSYPFYKNNLDLLNALGGIFLSRDGTDYEFRYTLHFDVDGGVQEAVNHTVLEVGYYIFIRENDRTHTTSWKELYLNTNNHLLYKKDSDNNKTDELYKENTYIVIEVNKNIGDVEVDLLTNNFQKFQDSIDTSEPIDWDKITNKFKIFAKFEKAKSLLNILIENNTEEKKQEKLQYLKIQANKFIDIIKETCTKDSTNSSLTDSQIDKLIEKISLEYKDVNYKLYTKDKFCTSTDIAKNIFRLKDNKE